MTHQKEIIVGKTGECVSGTSLRETLRLTAEVDGVIESAGR